MEPQDKKYKHLLKTTVFTLCIGVIEIAICFFFNTALLEAAMATKIGP